MSKLVPKSQLTFPVQKEIRIDYSKNERMYIGQIAEVIFSLSLIGIFLLVVTELISWKLFIILFSITILSGIVKFKIPSNSLKTIILKPNIFQYKYYVGANNRERRIRMPLYLDFRVETKGDGVKVWFTNLKNVVELHHAEDLPLLVEKTAEMFDMEFVDTCQLSGNQEILMYRSKSIQSIKYPSLVSIVERPDRLTIYDMNNQTCKVDFNSKNQKIIYTNYTVSSMPIFIDLQSIRTINVAMDAGNQVYRGKNRITIAIVFHNNNREVVFETMLRKQSQELTTLRDTTTICEQLKGFSALQHIEIVRKLDIR